MKRESRKRAGCKDVFHAFLVEDAVFDDMLEIPCLKRENMIPGKLLSFSKAVHSRDTDAWVHFYEDDVGFERLWNRPCVYLPILQKFQGVISPDFSMYRDMPLVMQQWNLYRGRALGYWLQKNGVHVIPNVRWGDERTFALSCVGVPKHGIIAVGSHGCVKNQVEREYFQKGLAVAIQQLMPHTILVYGTVPDRIFAPYRQQGIRILPFASEIEQCRKAVSG